MKHLTLVLLLALAPLSWGEDVYYCVAEHIVALEPTDSGDAYELNQYKPDRFTFKYEAPQARLVFKGNSWRENNEPYYMNCENCFPRVGTYFAGNTNHKFALMDGRFHVAAAHFESSSIKTGTCTKF